NIPAELAWEMNLPLPDGYKFIVLGFGLSASLAFYEFCKKIGINFCFDYYNIKINNKSIFLHIYNDSDIKKHNKLFFLTTKIPYLCLVSDPISRIKRGINHGWWKYEHQRHYDEYKLFDNIDYVLDRVIYPDCRDYNTFCKQIQSWIDLPSFNYSCLEKKAKQFVIIDSSEIMPTMILDTLNKIGKRFNFEIEIKNNDYFFEIKASEFRYILPIKFCFNIENINARINLTLKHEIPSNCIEINDFLNLMSLEYSDKICFSMNKNDIHLLYKLKNRQDIIQYFQMFVVKLKDKILKLDLLKATENMILECMQSNSYLAKRLSKKIKKDVLFIKQHRPDIVASWKYYQEFEKMCKELDGDCVGKTTE
ncbi:DUF2972 domain-containing protein, partial [Campylobacter jejuni]